MCDTYNVGTMKLLFVPLVFAIAAAMDIKDKEFPFTDGTNNARDTVLKYARDGWVKEKYGEHFGDQDFTGEKDPACHERWQFRMDDLAPGQDLPCKTWCVSSPTKEIMKERCPKNLGGYFCTMDEPTLSKDGKSFEQISFFEKYGMNSKSLKPQTIAQTKRGKAHCRSRIDDYYFTDGQHNTRDSIKSYVDKWVKRKAGRYFGNEDFTGNNDPECQKQYGLPKNIPCHTWCLSKATNWALGKYCKTNNVAGYFCTGLPIYYNPDTMAYERISYYEEAGAATKTAEEHGVMTSRAKNHCYRRYRKEKPKDAPAIDDGPIGLQQGIGPDGIPING